MVQIYRLKRVVASINYHHPRFPFFVILGQPAGWQAQRRIFSSDKKTYEVSKTS